MPHQSFAIALTTVILLTALAACSSKEPPAATSAATSDASQAAAPADSAAAPSSEAAPAPATTGTDIMPTMQKIELAPGKGAEIKSGQTALVHYTGWLYDAAAPENKGKK